MLGCFFYIFPITFGRVDNIESTTKRLQIEASRITYFSRKIPGCFGENLEKPRKLTPSLLIPGFSKCCMKFLVSRIKSEIQFFKQFYEIVYNFTESTIAHVEFSTTIITRRDYL